MDFNEALKALNQTSMAKIPELIKLTQLDQDVPYQIKKATIKSTKYGERIYLEFTEIDKCLFLPRRVTQEFKDILDKFQDQVKNMGIIFKGTKEIVGLENPYHLCEFIALNGIVEKKLVDAFNELSLD